MSLDQSPSMSSPFHPGERRLQTLSGLRDIMEKFGRKVIRPFLPQQHQDFYAQLPYIFVGSIDRAGNPWASMLCGQPGFISPVSDTQLRINSLPLLGDPLTEALQTSGNKNIGLLGIELTTRRRNRLSSQVVEFDDGGFLLSVDQCFGNCPQYIQRREVSFNEEEIMPGAEATVISQFDAKAISLIERSDTFFVASYYSDGSGMVSEGADVSHRGGKPGFVRVDDSYKLTIPDYAGNNHFNTLGNILENGKAGLLFVDFESGDVLTMTGRAEVILAPGASEYFEGAERLWQFDLVEARWLKSTLPFSFRFIENSPEIGITGSWPGSAMLDENNKTQSAFSPYTVVKIVDESEQIKSFYLDIDNFSRNRFKAGQFLTLKLNIDGKELIRTYTVSCAPVDEYYRISVKREGRVSNFLHDRISVGDQIPCKVPTGSFHLDDQSPRPVVLIAGGVGITPMLSMLRHGLSENKRADSARQFTLIAAAKKQQRAFESELQQLSIQSEGSIRCFWALSQLDENDKTLDGTFHHEGRIDKSFLQSVLSFDDYDFYLCGPVSFMQDIYDLLRGLGAADNRIFSEAFELASLRRSIDGVVASENAINNNAEAALISFVNADSGAEIEQHWTGQDDNLLEFAESHGLTPTYGCRSGQCGSCKVELTAGLVNHHGADESLFDEGEVLLCCATPAALKDGSLPVIKLVI